MYDLQPQARDLLTANHFSRDVVISEFIEYILGYEPKVSMAEGLRRTLKVCIDSTFNVVV